MAVKVSNDAVQQTALARRTVARMARNIGKPVVAIDYTAGGGRSAAKNTIIARTHRKLGRNPWFIDNNTNKRLSAIIQTASRRLLSGARNPLAVVVEMLEAIGRVLPREFRGHIERGVGRGALTGSGGPLPPLEPSTVKRKGHGRPLVDKGGLRDSMVPKVLRRK